MSSRRAVWASGALGAFVIAWWAGLFVGRGDVRAFDALLYFYPLYIATWERIAAGTLPLWNPYQLCGLPWLGTLQGGFFYPTHVLYAVVPVPAAFAVTSALHLVVVAVATAAFVRRLGMGTAAAFLAAVVFALRGRVASGMTSPNFLEAVTWLPVGAVALVDLVRAPSGRAVALLGFATGLTFLAGYPQPSVYVVYLWGSLAVALFVHEGVAIPAWPRRAAAIAAGLGLGAALAAVQMLPAAELARVGTRAPAGLSDRVMLTYGPLTPALLMLWKETITEAPSAFGVVVLGLVPAAFFARGGRVLACWATVVGFLSALWSLGRFTRYFDLFLYLPAVRWFRNPSHLLVLLDFCVAVAAALGLTAILGPRDADAPPRRRARLGGAAVAFVAAAALAVAGIRSGWVLRGAGSLGLVFAALGTLLVVPAPFASATLRRGLVLALVVVATVEISQNPWGSIRLPYAASDVGAYELLEAEVGRLAVLAGHDRVWPVGAGIQVDYAMKLASVRRLRSIVDYEPLNLQRQSDLFTYLTEGSTVRGRRPWLFTGEIQDASAPEGVAPVGTRRRLLDLASVRFVAFTVGAPSFPELTKLMGELGLVRVPGGGGRLVVFSNPAVLPRAFVTYRTRTAPPAADDLLAALSDATFDPMVESYVEGPPPFEPAADAQRGHPAAFVTDEETVVELEVRLERPGLVVLGDSYYPGWRATVDGTPAPIVPTNHLFRGVPAPAGTHRVRFEYAPASVRVGAAVSLGALVLLAWLALRRGAVRMSP